MGRSFWPPAKPFVFFTAFFYGLQGNIKGFFSPFLVVAPPCPAAFKYTFNILFLWQSESVVPLFSWRPASL